MGSSGTGEAGLEAGAAWRRLMVQWQPRSLAPASACGMGRSAARPAAGVDIHTSSRRPVKSILTEHAREHLMNDRFIREDVA